MRGTCYRRSGTDEPWVNRSKCPKDAFQDVYIVYSGASDQARLRIVHGWRAPSQDRDVGLDERNCSSRQQRSPKTIDATMPGAGKPISNALILRNAVVMRPLKSK